MERLSTSDLRKNHHLMWRAGFGPRLNDLDLLSTQSPESIWKKMLRDSEVAPVSIDVVTSDTLNTDATITKTQGSPESDRRRLARISRENIKLLNLSWVEQMVTSKQQLREKLSLFWHGHFAATSGNILHQQKLIGIIRNNALGNFSTLLKEVSKSASIINYLSNNQNRKNRPNENFAREVMELFTMGHGNYSEKDIKEAARAFTGWGATPSGEFVFRTRQHDEGEKEFMGRTGNFDGDDILNIILEQKQTALFITRKIYRYFVNDTVNETNIRWLADRFFSSGYNISGLVTDLFQSDWFYASGNMGNRIKSPVELIVGIRRILDLGIENKQVQLLLQRLLGQTLFYPPNVAGWPGGYNWIDSSSLMLRLQIPGMIIDAATVNLSPKDNDDQMMGMKDPVKPAIINKRISTQTIMAKTNWKDFLKVFETTRRERLAKQIAALIVTPPLTDGQISTVSVANAESRESFIKGTTVRLMCMPEYQLC
ncbi:MAG: DUF1800 domain-containing protein [Chitinophagaceae bacterium]|nr:MAG: DUF1800 domain-containing protein [Chitinophagaceae bacterium]